MHANRAEWFAGASCEESLGSWFGPGCLELPIFDCRLLMDIGRSCHTTFSIVNRKSAIGNENLVFGLRLCRAVFTAGCLLPTATSCHLLGSMPPQATHCASFSAMEWAPFLKQTVKTHNSANGVKSPSKGGWRHGLVSTPIHKSRIQNSQFIIALALPPLFNDSMIQ
jgi:hypothetical protein